MIARWPESHRSRDEVSDLLWYFPDLLPTVAELAGTAAPKDIDGLSIMCPICSARMSTGRKQPQHEYLYWELGGWTAVRMREHGKPCFRPNETQEWELYDSEPRH